LFAELTRARPGYGFLMEERSNIEGGERSHRCIFEPRDGATNFRHVIPIFAISIALEREGELVAGLIFNPANQETFTAERGKGAYLNDRRRLRVAARTELAASVIATGIPHSGRPEHAVFLRELQAVMASSARGSPHGRGGARPCLDRGPPARRL